MSLKISETRYNETLVISTKRISGDIFNFVVMDLCMTVKINDLTHCACAIMCMRNSVHVQF